MTSPSRGASSQQSVNSKEHLLSKSRCALSACSLSRSHAITRRRYAAVTCLVVSCYSCRAAIEAEPECWLSRLVEGDATKCRGMPFNGATRAFVVTAFGLLRSLILYEPSRTTRTLRVSLDTPKDYKRRSTFDMACLRFLALPISASLPAQWSFDCRHLLM